jgi:hypothetical protein
MRFFEVAYIFDKKRKKRDFRPNFSNLILDYLKRNSRGKIKNNFKNSSNSDKM